MGDIAVDKRDQICESAAAQDDETGLVDAQVAFLCLPHPDAVTQVVGNIAAQARGQHRTIIDFGAHAPDFAIEVTALCETQNIVYCDAPVFGTLSMAKSGDLYFLFSGPESIFTDFSQLVGRAGYRALCAGDSGMASTVKLLQNALGTVNFLACGRGIFTRLRGNEY